MIYTHLNVDLDAVLSLCCESLLHKVPLTAATVQFVPANQMDFPEYSTLIDLQINKHDRDHAYAEKYAEHIPDEISEEVRFQDCFGYDPGTWQIMLVALKKVGKTDLEICNYFLPIVDGLFRIQQDRIRAKPIYDQLPKVEIKGFQNTYKFLVIEYERSPKDVTFWAGRDGCYGTIYLENYNMGITRYNIHTEPNFMRLPKLSGWYQEKFIYVRGTRKSPATSFPPQFNNMDGFIAWLKQKFVEYKL